MVAREYFEWDVNVGDQAGTMHVYEVRNLWSPKHPDTEEAVERAAIAELRVKGIAAVTASAMLRETPQIAEKEKS